MNQTKSTIFSAENAFPPLPLAEWKRTKNTLHLYLQIVGKIRLKLHPRQNHWWHVAFYVSPRGLTTRPIPYGFGSFEIEFDFIAHELVVTAHDGARSSFALHDNLTVADFYRQTFATLAALGIETKIRAIPYEAPSKTPFAEDTENKFYDRQYVERFHRITVGVNAIFEEFRARFTGKSTPVHLFWHSFDLALTRFSGEPAPVKESAGTVEREAYSQAVISFGFWAGDDNVPAPAFYSYTAPEPENLTGEKLKPEAATWNTDRGAMAILMYDDALKTAAPRRAILEFLESAYQAGAKRAGWDTEKFTLKPLK